METAILSLQVARAEHRYGFPIPLSETHPEDPLPCNPLEQFQRTEIDFWKEQTFLGLAERAEGGWVMILNGADPQWTPRTRCRW
jgi:hypothetical protein